MRAIWSGMLSFGLINIPVKLYSASEERKLKFKLLDKNDHCPISYARICRATNKEVKYEDIVRGYEYQKGDFVILTDDDFKQASPQKTKTIEISSFVDEREIEPHYYKSPYYIEPDKNAGKAYVLLRDALRRAGKVGIARMVLHDREHVAIIKAEETALMLVELRYQDEIREPRGLNLPEKAEYSSKELDIALLLINQLEEHFRPSEYHDTYTEELEKIISKKAEGQPVHIKEAAPVPTTDMRDLMDMLRKSLESAKTTNRKPVENAEPKPRRVSQKAHAR